MTDQPDPFEENATMEPMGVWVGGKYYPADPDGDVVFRWTAAGIVTVEEEAMTDQTPATEAGRYAQALVNAGDPDPFVVAEYIAKAEAEARADCDEARRLLGYLWTATGKSGDDPVYSLFDADDPIVADIDRLAIKP